MRKIIVIGMIHHNTLGMIRCIGKANYRTDLILVGNDGYISKSRYIRNKTIIDSEKDVIDVLLTKYGNEADKPIIISCTDKVESLLDLNFELLSDKFEFFNCGEKGIVTKYMNKDIQCELAMSVGLNIPWTTEYSKLNQYIKFPCLLKPIQSINGGKKILLCSNFNEFQRSIKKFAADEPFLVQEFLEKKEEIVILGCSTENGIEIPGYILKHRDYNGGTLYSSVCPIETISSQLISKCRDLIIKMNYKGLFGIEIIQNQGQYYFIEINLRNDATTYSLAVAGANLPQLYIDSIIKESHKSAYQVKNIRSIVEFNDFKHRKENNISFFKWINQLMKSKAKYYWNKNDILPFIFAPINFIKSH